MPNNQSLLAYADIKEILDRVVAEGRGVRLEFGSDQEAHRFVGRCCSFRALDRKENTRIFEATNVMHGRSMYDPLKITRDGAFVEIYRWKIGAVKIEWFDDPIPPPEKDSVN